MGRVPWGLGAGVFGKNEKVTFSKTRIFQISTGHYWGAYGRTGVLLLEKKKTHQLSDVKTVHDNDGILSSVARQAKFYSNNWKKIQKMSGLNHSALNTRFWHTKTQF